jgi:hypothetical protein
VWLEATLDDHDMNIISEKVGKGGIGNIHVLAMNAI